MIDEVIPDSSQAASNRLVPSKFTPVLGVCGGSGSGKSYLVRQLDERCAERNLTLTHVSFDAYYHDLQHLTKAERALANFDHPDSLDGKLFVEHVVRLANGEAVDVPTYDFANHSRTGQTETVGPADVVIVDGILLFAFPAVRAAIDISIYLDVPADLRLDRRVARDTVERGRDVADVERQWREFVEPMHKEHVEAHADSADLIVGYGDDREALLDQLMHAVSKADVSESAVGTDIL